MGAKVWVRAAQNPALEDVGSALLGLSYPAPNLPLRDHLGFPLGNHSTPILDSLGGSSKGC